MNDFWLKIDIGLYSLVTQVICNVLTAKLQNFSSIEWSGSERKPIIYTKLLASLSPVQLSSAQTDKMADTKTRRDNSKYKDLPSIAEVPAYLNGKFKCILIVSHED